MSLKNCCKFEKSKLIKLVLTSVKDILISRSVISVKMGRNTIVVKDETELITVLADWIKSLSTEAIEEKNQFLIGVSGGSLVNFLKKALISVDTDFKKWKIFFCDERVVPIDSPDSTYGAYKFLIDSFHLQENQFVTLKQGVTVEEAAIDYQKQMQEFFKETLPRFDLLLLGMGPDGHTCSLFPNHPLLEETSLWVAPISDSPKPPPERITITFPVINNAKCCIFTLTGAGKADMVKRVLKDKEDFPVTRVLPTSGSVYWIVDEAAAKLYLEQ